MNIVFAQQLRAIRLKRGYTQQGLARVVGLPPSQVSHFEAGQRLPSVQNLARLATALGVSTDYLLGRTDQEAKTYTDDTRKERLMQLSERLTAQQLDALVHMAHVLQRKE